MALLPTVDRISTFEWRGIRGLRYDIRMLRARHRSSVCAECRAPQDRCMRISINRNLGGHCRMGRKGLLGK